MKKSIRKISIIIIGGLFLFSINNNLFGTISFLEKENNVTYWYLKGKNVFISTAYADRDDDDRDDDDRDDDRDDRDDDDDDRDDFGYYVPAPVQTQTSTPSQTPVQTQTSTPSQTPIQTCTTVYDTVTSASGTKSKVPRDVCTTPTSVQTPTPTPATAPAQTPAQTPIQTPVQTPVSNNSQSSFYTDGTYTGDGAYKFPEGSITYTVSITILSGKIADATFLNFTPSGNGLYTLADGQNALRNIVASQNTQIDTVTGASGTSVAVQNAVNNALAKARSTNQTSTSVQIQNPVPTPVQTQTTQTPNSIQTLQAQTSTPTSALDTTLALSIQGVDNIISRFSNGNELSQNTISEKISLPSVQEIQKAIITLAEIEENLPGDTSQIEQEYQICQKIVTSDKKEKYILQDPVNDLYYISDSKIDISSPEISFQFEEDAVAYTKQKPIPQKSLKDTLVSFFFKKTDTSTTLIHSNLIDEVHEQAKKEAEIRNLATKKSKIREKIAILKNNLLLAQNNENSIPTPSSSITQTKIAPKAKIAVIQPKIVPQKTKPVVISKPVATPYIDTITKAS